LDDPLGIDNMPDAQTTPKGPWMHRFLVHLFTVVLTILIYWLLGFIVDDIGTAPGPQYSEVEARLLDQQLLKTSHDLQGKIADVNRQIRDQKGRQEILADSTANSQKTMNQLLEIQKLALQKDVTPGPDELKSLESSKQLFLENQKQYQVLNEEIAHLNNQLQDLEEELRSVEHQLDEGREPVQREWESEVRSHDLKLAFLKLAALAPLLLVAAWLFLKKRAGLYAPLVYAFGIALLVKIAEVMHEYFPTRYFKYVLILACLAAVVRILVYLLTMIAFPKKDWLLKQYREAYEAFFCPVCEYPIRRGPLKFMFWSRRSIRKIQIPPASNHWTDEPYTCPMCATKLFEECPSCHAVRHSLLPACEKCGAEKPPRMEQQN
jgi:hypothetical protein